MVFKAVYQTYDSSSGDSLIEWLSFKLLPDGSVTTPPPILASTESTEVALVLTAQAGLIISPDYPTQFPYRLDKLWIIRPAQQTFITLVFEDIDFDVLRDDSSHCNTLYTHVVLTVYTVDSRRSSELIICQNDMLTNVYSHGELKLAFHSSYGVGRGFKASYSSGNGEGDTETKELPIPTTTDDVASLLTSSKSFTELIHPEDRISEGCLYTLMQSRRQISSPNYPSMYPQSIVCQWIILAPAGQLVRLDFFQFLLDSNDSSPCDTKYSHIIITTSDTIGDQGLCILWSCVTAKHYFSNKQIGGYI